MSPISNHQALFKYSNKKWLKCARAVCSECSSQCTSSCDHYIPNRDIVLSSGVSVNLLSMSSRRSLICPVSSRLFERKSKISSTPQSHHFPARYPCQAILSWRRTPSPAIRSRSPWGPIHSLFTHLLHLPHDRWASYASDKQSQKHSTQIGKCSGSVLPCRTATRLSDWGVGVSFRRSDKSHFTVSQWGTG